VPNQNVMANSTTVGAPRVQIMPEYRSADEPLELLLFHHLKSSTDWHQRAWGGRDMWTATLSGIKPQNYHPNGIRLKKQCKMIGQKSDKAKSKSLKQELLSREGKVLQNLYSAVRSRPAPPAPPWI
jgi:hypothetical protein